MAMNESDDAFDRFLAQSLAPPERMPDNQFIRRVNQRIQLDTLHRRNRAKMFERLGVEVLSVMAVGCGLAALGAGAGIADSAGNIPAVPLVGMVILFGLWVTLVSRQERVGTYN